MRLARLPLLLTFFVLALSVTCAVAVAGGKPAGRKMTAKDAGPIVEGIIKAYGGKAAIAAVKGVYVKAGITAEMRGDTGTYVRYLERPRKLRVEIDYSRSSELRILNGDEGWRGEGKGALVRVGGFQLLSMVYQYKQLEIPYGLATGAYKVRWSGEGMVGGTRADILTLTDAEGPEMDIYVDPKSRLILRTSGYFEMNGRQADLTAEFSDFREMGGTVIPFTITNYSQGFKIGVTTIKQCEVNLPMEEALFRP